MSTLPKKEKKRQSLNPDAQWLILETATVNDLKNRVDYANSSIFRSFRLNLVMEDKEEVTA
jgi:hypothetical protein